jgi:hypothetical protein
MSGLARTNVEPEFSPRTTPLAESANISSVDPWHRFWTLVELLSIFVRKEIRFGKDNSEWFHSLEFDH